MNDDIKTAWVAALRSGEFQQGRSVLKREMPDGSYRHCCLGVLCELAVQQGVPLAINSIGDEICFDEESKTLPFALFQWADLDDEDEEGLRIGINHVKSKYPHESGSHLADLNDNGVSFLEIADLIEEHM